MSAGQLKIIHRACMPLLCRPASLPPVCGKRLVWISGIAQRAN